MYRLTFVFAGLLLLTESHGKNTEKSQIHPETADDAQDDHCAPPLCDRVDLLLRMAVAGRDPCILYGRLSGGISFFKEIQ